MTRWVIVALVLAFAGLTAETRAQNKAADATGAWKWTFDIGGESRELTLKVKQEGDKLTGVYVGPDGKETKIEEGKVKDGEVSFKVTREREGQKFVIKFKGKVS